MYFSVFFSPVTKIGRAHFCKHKKIKTHNRQIRRTESNVQKRQKNTEKMRKITQNSNKLIFLVSVVNVLFHFFFFLLHLVDRAIYSFEIFRIVELSSILLQSSFVCSDFGEAQAHLRKCVCQK